MAGGIEAQVQLHGLEELGAWLEAAAEKAPHLLGSGLYQEAEAVMTESKEQVPVEIGTLKNSGHVQLPEYLGDAVTVRMGYGGAAAAYAWIQHERLDFMHPHGGKAKYLEDPVLKAAAGIGHRLAEHIARGLGG